MLSALSLGCFLASPPSFDAQQFRGAPGPDDESIAPASVPSRCFEVTFWKGIVRGTSRSIPLFAVHKTFRLFLFGRLPKQQSRRRPMSVPPAFDSEARLMSALGHWRTSKAVRAMSALPPKADMVQRSSDVRYVPKADILHCGKERRYSITSSTRSSPVLAQCCPDIAICHAKLSTGHFQNGARMITLGEYSIS